MRFLKAHKIFNGKAFLPNDQVLVLNAQHALKDIISESDTESGGIERLEGILTPGFVNVHCHLELSHLKGKIAKNTGLPQFAKEVITQRINSSKEEIAACMKAADRDMWNNGIVAVGDICNSGDSFEQKTRSNIHYHSFVELIGLNPANSASIFEKGNGLLSELKKLGLNGSLAAHAPYSTSKQLIGVIAEADAAHDLPFSIHNEESDEELKFFKGEKNGFDELYKFLGLDLSWFRAPGQSSLHDYVSTLNGTRSLLIHNTFTNVSDVALTHGKNIHWGFCPNANLYIEGRQPAYDIFNLAEARFCLGTDSLASNTALDLVAEANSLLSVHPSVPDDRLLKALTLGGAEALGIQNKYGQLITGLNTGLNLVTFKDHQLNLIKKIT